MRTNFLEGVVEGFYGQPWTQPQRLDLFDQMVMWELNTYVYAPKDDLKHRAIWREEYTAAEISKLAQLVDACSQRGVTFIYGLSPGLDIRFSDAAELANIKRRFQQLIQVGVSHFALLFDDLPGNMHAADQSAFDSVATAQGSVTNLAFNWLRQKDAASQLLFCPTPYCDRMVGWELGGGEYLNTIGTTLHPEIDILWTGPEIISREISVEAIQSLIAKIRRPPVIWDNLHANDYDLRRLYCGPYSGRPLDLRNHVRGILTNPNNEFPINYVPLMTLGKYLHSDNYEPRSAFLSAIESWLEKFHSARASLAFDDLVLLADCYYLPYEEGPSANQLYEVIVQLLDDSPAEWNDSFAEFQALHGRVRHVFEVLTELTDRELFYAWSRRVWELKEELDLLNDFFQRKQRGADSAAGISSETHLPFTYRGGIVSRLQARLEMDTEGRFHPRS